MCLQCVTESNELFKFGQYSVQIATKDSEQWKLYHLGIVESNDPFCYIPINLLMIDPFDGMSDDDIDNSSSELMEDFSIFTSKCHELVEYLKIHPKYSTMLWIEAEREGYVEEYHGRFEIWLNNYLSKKYYGTTKGK